MATLETDGDALVVRLSAFERLAALRGDVRVPLSAITSVEIEPDPWSALRGIRAPGTGWPGVIAYGVWRFSGGRDFVLVRSRRPAVRIDLDGASTFARLLITIDDPEGWVDMIQHAVAKANSLTNDGTVGVAQTG
jgi:hypothetical protein